MIYTSLISGWMLIEFRKAPGLEKRCWSVRCGRWGKGCYDGLLCVGCVLLQYIFASYTFQSTSRVYMNLIRNSHGLFGWILLIPSQYTIFVHQISEILLWCVLSVFIIKSTLPNCLPVTPNTLTNMTKPSRQNTFQNTLCLSRRQISDSSNGLTR